MKTISVNISQCSDENFVSKKQQNYSFAFRKLHAGIDKINDKKFCDSIQKKYKMTDIEFRSLQSEVAVKNSQTTTNKSECEQRIVDLISDLKVLQKEIKSNKITRSKFKKHNKIKALEGSLSKNITFGGKENLRELTKLHNNIKTISKEKDLVKREKLLSENNLKIEEKVKLWKENRILHFYILGEANQKANRFFTFDFANKKIIYKPFKGKKIEIKYSCKGNHQKQLLKLQELINDKKIALTIQISTKQICIAFDDEILSGYYIDKQERKKEVKSIDKDLPKESKKKLINLIYKKYFDDLRDNKLKNKISERYIAVDLNPDYIGYCIADKGTSGIKKIIETGTIDFRLLHEKLGLASDNSIVVKQNNKCKNEVQNALVKLFEIVSHYKCAYFVHEDLSNISKSELGAKEANRKVKNIWHRNLTEWQIAKRCVELGVEIIPINACYTSFIGNLMYDNFDATNASIEICRRGMFKFNKGLFFPEITGTISDTMSKFFDAQNIKLKPRDAQIFKDCDNWKKLYKIASDNGLRWRWDWNDVEKQHSIFSMDSVKSKVKFVRFSVDYI